MGEPIRKKLTQDEGVATKSQSVSHPSSSQASREQADLVITRRKAEIPLVVVVEFP